MAPAETHGMVAGAVALRGEMEWGQRHRGETAAYRSGKNEFTHPRRWDSSIECMASRGTDDVILVPNYVLMADDCEL